MFGEDYRLMWSDRISRNWIVLSLFLIANLITISTTKVVGKTKPYNGLKDYYSTVIVKSSYQLFYFLSSFYRSGTYLSMEG